MNPRPSAAPRPEGVNERNISIQSPRVNPPSRELLNLKGGANRGSAFALDFTNVPLALEAKEGGQLLLSDTQLFSEIGDVHALVFPYRELNVKLNVLYGPDDVTVSHSHTANMNRKARKLRPAQVYEEYRQKSGWYLAAWRDYCGFTLDEVASELDRSKGFISDLETGAMRSGKAPARFNRDLIEEMAKVMRTTGGRLIDINPLTHDEMNDAIVRATEKLDSAGKSAVLSLALSWAAHSNVPTSNDT